MFTKKTIRDVDLQGKRVLLRADYNVPIDDAGQITADFRIRQSLQTIRALLEQNVRLVICSHLGRPEGKRDDKFSLRPVAARLSELLGQEVAFVDDCIGANVQQAVDALMLDQVLLLENVRFYPGEEANDEAFAAELAKFADVFVQDGFGVVHRAHATTDAITRHLPSVAGLLLEQEVDTLTNAIQNPKRPLMAIVAGAKIADKIDNLTKFIDTADFVAVGGAMANTFLAARGLDVGKSMHDADGLELAKEIMRKAEEKEKNQHFIFFLPQDGIVAKTCDKAASTRLVDWDADLISEVQSYPKLPEETSHTVAADEMILDIGPFSAAFIAGAS
jgi:phosphoglycerate kinase